jgi:hypothetical protein
MEIPNYPHQLIEMIAAWNLDPIEISERLTSWYGTQESALGHVNTVIETLNNKIANLEAVASHL